MKTTITALLFGTVLSLQAQFEPFDQQFYRSMNSALSGYDSINIWFDTISPQNFYGSYSMELLPNGMLDTMVFMEQASQNYLYQFSGTSGAGEHTVISNYNTSIGLLPYLRTRFELDAQNRPTYVYMDDFDGTSYTPFSQQEIRYLSNGKWDEIVENYYTGTNYIPGASTKYHYSNGILDSVVRTDYYDPWGNTKVLPKYNSSNQVTFLEFYEQVTQNGDMQCVQRHRYIYDGARIRYTLIYLRDFITDEFYLSEIHEYAVKANSNIGLPYHKIPRYRVYPNPVINQVKVEGANLCCYAILDYNGAIVMEGKVEKAIDLSTLKSGHYLLKLTNRKGQSTIQKIIKR